LDEEGLIRAIVVLPDGEEVPLAIETSRPCLALTVRHTSSF
jgi:hypothetical protein